MSEEEVEEEFSDTTGEEGDPPAAEWGVPPLDAWIVELVAKVGGSRKLSEADQLRLPTALQLQNQHAIVVQQAKAEAAAQKVAEQQSARDSEILKQLSAVKEESSSKIAALEAELAAVKRGKEEDVEPQFREFVERDAKNPFGGPGTVRGGDDLEPRLRAYPDEVAYKWIESKGGKDFFNFQALESAAEVLFDVRAKFAKLCPFVVETINPDRIEDEADEKYRAERELCKVYNSLSAAYDNIINPQLSYLQLEAVLKKKHGATSDNGWVQALLNCIQRQLHGVVGTPLPENLAPKFHTVITDLETRFGGEIAKQAAKTAANTSTRSPYQQRASGSFGSTVASRAAARSSVGGSVGGFAKRG